MNPKKHHFVPRFLLKRFASEESRSSPRVWQFRKGAEPILIGVRDAAASSYFYGKSDANIENSLAEIESRHAPILDALQQGDDLNDWSAQVRDLTWLMAVRTRHLRDRFASMAQRGVELLAAGASTHEAKEGMAASVEQQFDAEWDRVLGSLPPAQRAIARLYLAANPEFKQQVLQGTQALVRQIDLGALIASAFDSRKGIAASSAEKGHLSALAKLMARGTAPDSFGPLRWTLIRFAPHTVVLGDISVVSRNAQGEWGHLLKFGRDWVDLYLPVAHDAVIRGEASPGMQEPAPLDQINAASISLSDLTVFASTRDAIDPVEIDQIGANAQLMSDDELDASAREAWTTLAD